MSKADRQAKNRNSASLESEDVQSHLLSERRILPWPEDNKEAESRLRVCDDREMDSWSRAWKHDLMVEASPIRHQPMPGHHGAPAVRNLIASPSEIPGQRLPNLCRLGEVVRSEVYSVDVVAGIDAGDAQATVTQID